MDPYQKILQKAYDRKLPFFAHWELTYRCNLSCLHCYATNRNRTGELTTREIGNILEQLAEMGCLFLTFTGGEVFLRSDLMPILKLARSSGFALHLFTNGTLMTPEAADELTKIEPLSVEMSLYGIDPAVHDRITGVRGSHAKTMSAIKLCREREINIAIKSMVMKENISEYEALRKFAGEVGARFVFDFVLVPADDGSRPMAQHGLSEEQIFEFILANAESTGKPPAAPDMSAPLCGAGSNTISINPFGDVFPCLAVRESVGNLKKRSLRQIWNSSSLDKIRNSRYSDLVNWRNCEYTAYCSRCAGVALAECGDILGRSESACAVARATKRAVETLLKDCDEKTKEKEIR